MPNIKCPYCGAETSADNDICPHCHHALDKQSHTPNILYMLLTMVLVVIMGLLAYVLLHQGNNPIMLI